MKDLPDFWGLVLSLLFAGLWLWTLWRCRKQGATPAPLHGISHGRIEAEDILKAAYALQEKEGSWTDKSLARWMDSPEDLAREAAQALVAFGWAEEGAGAELRLTPEGRSRAEELIRAHRLWELYLVDRERMSLEEVHAEAHRREHDTTAEEIERLDRDLEHPAWDPHGHIIPASGCRVPAAIRRTLFEEGTPESRLRIVSLDDEPAALLAQLMALGLGPGVELTVVERASDRLWLQVNGDSIPVALAAARHVCVITAPVLPVELGRLPSGSRAQVLEIRGDGKHQRRMLDMGFVPGADIAVIRTAPLGDPVEYEIKGTAVALRRDDANTVLVEEVDGD